MGRMDLAGIALWFAFNLAAALILLPRLRRKYDVDAVAVLVALLLAIGPILYMIGEMFLEASTPDRR